MSETNPLTGTAGDALRAPIETLTGDRLCMQCMHPLVGSPITREPQTGLLYVRCGECGTASALFEYPTVGPWIRRMKAVASSTLVVIALMLIIVVGGIAFGFTTGAARSASESAGSVLLERYRALGGVVDEPGFCRVDDATGNFRSASAGEAPNFPIATCGWEVDKGRERFVRGAGVIRLCLGNF
jgi:hypothetical protein